MQLLFQKNKLLRIIAITLLTAGIFLVVSVLLVYQTGIYHHEIWTFLGPSDNRFHMMRIEGLYQSIKHHAYFPFVNMSFMDGFGYISNIFYSDFALYPAAFLRLLGFSSAKTIVIYYAFLNFLTFTTAFLCFFKISKKYWNSLVFSFVYTLGNYRLHDMLFRHDIGELAAFVFLPIALLGIYEIFYGNRKKWLYLTFGMTGIIYSHAISPILVAILIIAVFCCQINELKIHPKRLWSLLWAVCWSLLLSLGYFLPILEQLKHTTFTVSRSKSILPAGASNLTDAFNWSLNNIINQPNIGLMLLIATLIALISLKKIKNRAVKHFTVIGVVLFICTTKVFPWEFFNKTPFKVIQYPWRLDMLVTILLAVFVASDPLHLFKTNLAKLGLVLCTFLLAISASYRLVNSDSGAMTPYREYDQPSPFSIGAGQEYLPYKTNLNELETTAHQPKAISGNIQITHFKQTNTKLSFNFQNAKNTKVILPIIGYYGFRYQVNQEASIPVKMVSRNNNLAQITLNDSGKVRVDYVETPIQKIGRRISVLSLIILIILIIWKRFFPIGILYN